MFSLNNLVKTNLLYNKTCYNSTTFINFNVFILYGFHTLVYLFINLKPVIMICKVRPVVCIAHVVRVTSLAAKFAIYLLDTQSKLKGDVEISTNT